MVPMELLMLEDEVSDDGEHHEGDTFLNDLQLHKVKGAAIVHKTDTVSGNLAAVFKESNHPREGNDQIEGPVGGDARLLEAQVTIPGKSHEHIAHYEQQNRINSIRHWIGKFKNGAKLQK